MFDSLKNCLPRWFSKCWFTVPPATCGRPSPSALSTAFAIVCLFFYFSCPSWGEVICISLMTNLCSASFPMHIGYLHIFIGEMSIHILCLRLHWVVFLLLRLYVFFTYSQNKYLVRHLPAVCVNNISLKHSHACTVNGHLAKMAGLGSWIETLRATKLKTFSPWPLCRRKFANPALDENTSQPIKKINKMLTCSLTSFTILLSYESEMDI